MARTRLSLVMPAFNEEAGIAESVAEAHEALCGLDYEFEIIVVDDGSRDRTAEITAELAQDRPEIRLIRHDRNRGYGAALRTGFQAAEYDLVAFTDADAQFYIEDIADLVTLTRECPVAVGRRRHRQDPALRRFYSWGYNRLITLLLGTGVRDCDCALKVFRAEYLEYLLPTTRGFFVNTEMLFRARQFGWEIAEVDVRHRRRRRGESKVSIIEIPRVFGRLMRFWWTNVVRGVRPTAPRVRTRHAVQAVLPFRRAEAEIPRAA